MSFKDLMPWKPGKTELPLRREESHPFAMLSEQMNRLFDSFTRGLELEPFGAMGGMGSFMPKLDMSEDEKEYRITAELPGVDEKDLELKLADDLLTLSGKKQQEHEDRGKDFYRKECSYGSFRRTIPLPSDVDRDGIQAELKKGVLTLTMPKSKEARSSSKTIPVQSQS